MDTTLCKQAPRKTYLITYSKVDKTKSSDKGPFAAQVIEAFVAANESNFKPKHWVSCEKSHQDG